MNVQTEAGAPTERADHAEIRGAMALDGPAHRASQICPRPEKNPAPDGGADRARTDDLRLARAALSQLSYSPSRSSAARTVRRRRRRHRAPPAVARAALRCRPHDGGPR